MTKHIAAVLVLFSLGAGAAHAGGWATAGLTPPPDGIAPGDVWEARVTILQHGRTPLAGVEPTVTIRQDDEAKTFTAAATDQRGVYVARVTFPAGGEWRYEVNDDFPQGAGRVHTFAPVEVGSPSGGGGGMSPWWIAVPVALLAATGVLGLRRRWTARPAGASTSPL